MAHKNNKGFSLIEIVIAMAVLTLLLTPIIKQFAQTMRVSRLAKEQQYVNEEAIFALEEAQVTSKDELIANYTAIAATNPDVTFATSSDPVACTLVTTSGNEIDLVDEKENAVTDNKVNYTVESYVLKHIEVGPENDLYNKVISVDNLATQIRGYKTSVDKKGLKIKYNMTSAEVPDGYTLTSEGSAVKTDGNGNVISVVVEETNYVGNPNSTNLGNMQNLDYETVAMITGSASNFDDTAERTMYADAMDELKEANYDAWETHMKHSTGDGPLFQSDTVFDREKLTKIYVDEVNETSGEKYYIVKVDVYYSYSFQLAQMADPVSGNVSYNVFAQKFYTDKCPDIYFEYQPFITELSESGGAYNVEYADNDYILIDNYVDDVKLYVYKPFLDAENVADGKTETDYTKVDSYLYDSLKYNEDENRYDLIKTKINIASANNSVKEVDIYTNLDVEDNGAASQFFVDHTTFSNFDFVDSDKAADDASLEGAAKQSYTRSKIMSIDQDTRYNDRLRTVTVSMIPVELTSTENADGSTEITESVRDDANTVTLTGAKGEK